MIGAVERADLAGRGDGDAVLADAAGPDDESLARLEVGGPPRGRGSTPSSSVCPQLRRSDSGHVIGLAYDRRDGRSSRRE